MSVTAREDRIRRFRTIDRSADAFALRRHIERTFAARALRPLGFSQTAIVCVRTLRLPQAIGSHAWTETLDREIRRLVAGAVHPFRETVPAGAAAVVFADEAELLACLARDWRRGDGGAWWWHALVGRDVSEEVVVDELVKAMPNVPGAIAWLAAKGIVVDVIGQLPTLSCARLLNGLIIGFAVPGIDDAFALDRDTILRRIEGVPALTIRQQRRAEAALALSPDEDVRDLALPHRGLIATALMLERDATLARTPGVLAVVSRGWWPGPGKPVTERTSADAGPPPRELALPAQASPPATVATPALRLEPARNRTIMLSPSTLPAEVIGMKETGGDRLHGQTATSVAAPAGERRISAPVDRQAQRAHEDAAPPEPARALFVASQFAGVLYLLNVGLHLEWYGDFSQPARPGLSLAIGDFLALVGERACGRTLRGDSLWRLLAGLADRDPADPPGEDATPPAGMTLNMWVDDLTRQLAERTAAALGVGPELALAFLCVRAGGVALSPTRLDIEFPLADHPLAIRLAGLDRNPGWVPAAGRSVEFHFR